MESFSLSETPIVLAAFLVSAGIVLYTGIQAAIVGFVGHRVPLYMAFAITCFCAAGFQLSSTTYYLASSVPAAGAALRWQVAFLTLFFPAFFAFVALYTGQRRIKPWLAAVTLVFGLMLVWNFVTPYSLRFATLEATAPLHLPWGETLARFSGEVAVGNSLMRAGAEIIFLWAVWRAVVKFRRGERREALFLAACLALLIASSVWGALIDLGIIDSFYVAAFAYLGLALLMSASMGMALRDHAAALEVAAADLRGEVERRRKLEEAIKHIATGVSIETGAPFFRKLVQELARLSGADCAFVGVFDERDRDALNTLAVWSHGKPDANLTYRLEHGPCADVQGPRTCVHPQGVRQEFPRDPLLRDLNADGYIGTRLFGVSGEPLGLVVVLDGKPIRDSALIANILEIFAARAGAEIQRLRAEERMRKLSTAVEQSPAAVIITDRAGRIEYVNPAFCQLSGYVPEEAVGQTPRLLKSGETPPEEYARLWRTITAGGQWRGEFHNRRKDGSLYWVTAAISPIVGPERRVTHFLSVQEDVTAQKQAAAEREQLQHQLQQAQKMEVIGRLTGGIAHDFNNILASILGFSSLALERHVPDPNSKLAEYLRAVHSTGERARDLIAQMLAFSRGDKGAARVLEAEPLVDEVLKMLRATLPASIETHKEFAPDLPAIRVDPVQLHQIVTNLCINAADAMEGVGRLDIRLRHARGVTGACRSCHQPVTGDFVELAVGDTGGGMDENLLDRVFEPFFTTKAVGKGTGLGLSVVHGIVHEHGGHIQVESTVGQGSTFRILFPALPDDVRATIATVVKVESCAAGNGARIMVIDDEAILASYISELLEAHGYAVTIYTDPEAALRGFEADPGAVDLVLTDQTMPGRTGAALAEAMLARRPDLPIILCSGCGDGVFEQRVKRLNLGGVLSKPIDAARLLDRVEQLLTRNRLASASL